MSTADAEPKRLSCVSCRQRKIKCNRLDPCNHCVKAGQKCVFPRPVRVRGGSKVRNAEITKRISRLEGLLRKLNGDQADAVAADIAPGDLPGVSDEEEEETQPGPASAGPSAAEVREHQPLHKSDGTTYLAGDLWATLSGEVDGLRQLLDESSDDEDEHQSASSRSRGLETVTSISPFFFHHLHPPMDLRQLHPHPPLITTTFCDVYFSRVDPCFKVLHQPTMRQALATAAADLKRLSGNRPMEALMFAFYFITISSLHPDECKRLFCDDKESLQKRYKQATEAALANADFLNCTELTTLQAFVMYVLALRTTTTSRAAWALASLAARLGQAQNLHRNEDNEAVPPFEAQLRRRTWWGIVMMDSCFSEDRGTPRSFLSPFSSARQAANVNDADIWPGMTKAPVSRDGWTEMTFCLLCHEAAVAATMAAEAEERSGKTSAARDVPGAANPQRSLDEVVCEWRDRMETKWLKDLNEAVPLQWVASRVSRLIVVRRFLGIYYPLHTRRVIRRSVATKQNLLAAAVSALEVGDEVENSPVAQPFVWFITLWSQWYCLSVALAELCTQTKGPQVERAWSFLGGGRVEAWAPRIADGSGGLLWKPIGKLWDKARDVRLATTGQAVGGARHGSSSSASTRGRHRASTSRTPWDLTTPSTTGSMSPPDADAQEAAAGLVSQISLGNSVIGADGMSAVMAPFTSGGDGRGLPWLFDGGPAVLPGAQPATGAVGMSGVNGANVPLTTANLSDPAVLAMDVDADVEIEGWDNWEQFLTGTFPESQLNG